MHRILRVPPRESLCTTDDGDAIKNVHGTVVVWWNERIKKNFDAQSIPYVDIVFRYLDRYDEPAGFHVAQIGISRLGSFRLGTIWKNGRCVAETDLGDDEEFTVDFTEGTYSYLSITGSSRNYPFFKEDYRLRPQPTSSVITELLNFPLSPEQNLLIPCIEFLYRCYGSTSDMGRILATYPWDEVVERLYATTIEKDVNTWLVRPAPDVPNDDALFLASALYDPYTQNAAKMIYAQLDNARGHQKHETSLRVKPWFQGPAKLRVRGRWINNGNTFLCYEVTGMSQPQHHPYEIRRVKYLKSDLRPDEPPIDLYKRKIELPKQEDPFAITDHQEPDVGASKWSKPDPGFRIVGPKCAYTTSFEERSFSKRQTVPDRPNEGKVRSTGDPTGHNKNVQKFTAVAKRVIGDGGVLAAVWEELKRLSKERSGFILSWKSEKKGFVQSSYFRLLPLAPFSENDSPEDASRRWLVYSANANGTRGILVIRAKIDDRTFYLLELQRKKVLKKKAYVEEQISGLLLEVNNETEAAIEISRICDEIRSVSGNFRKLKTPISHSYRIFRHFPSVRSTLHYAFENLGIMLYKKTHK